MTDLFVYGTLRDPAVRHNLLGPHTASQHQTAHARGWRVAEIRRVDYPAIIQAVGATASGDLLLGLSSTAMALLDAYEGDEYALAEINIEVLDDAGAVVGKRRASTYLPSQALIAQLQRPYRNWSFERWSDSPAARRRRNGPNMF